MPDRLIRPGTTSEALRGPYDPLPDISQLVTARLEPRSSAEPHTRQIAQHEAEIQRLVDLAATLEQAVSALMSRLRLTTDVRLYAALQHNSADLQHFKLEVDLLRVEHQRAVERLTGRTGL
jgi:hypothetical protein